MIELGPLAWVFSVSVVCGSTLFGLRLWLDSKRRLDIHDAMDALRAQFAELATELRKENNEAKATVAEAVKTINGVAVAAGLRRVPRMEQTPPQETK